MGSKKIKPPRYPIQLVCSPSEGVESFLGGGFFSGCKVVHMPSYMILGMIQSRTGRLMSNNDDSFLKLNRGERVD